MVGIRGGTVLLRTWMVASATCSANDLDSDLSPGRTIEAFKTKPAKSTRCKESRSKRTQYLYTSIERSMGWLWVINTSGSTIGTSPTYWETAGYRASTSALSVTARTNGVVGETTYGQRYLLDLAPRSQYCLQRSRRPSRPCIVISSGDVRGTPMTVTQKYVLLFLWARIQFFFKKRL